MTDEEREELTARAREVLQNWEGDVYDDAREAWTAADEVLEQRQYLDRELAQRLDDLQNQAARIVTEAHLGE